MPARTVLLLLLVAPVVEAQPFEAVVMGGHQVCNFHRESTTHQRTLEWVNPDAVESNTPLYWIASSASGRLFGLIGSQPYQIAAITPDGGRTVLATAPGRGSMIAVAPGGRMYVLAVRGGHTLDRFSPDGVLEASYPLGQPVGVGFEVAPDGCTVYFTSSAGRDMIANRIQRINGCTGERLPDFTVVMPPVEDIEVQPDGQLLVATRQDVRLYDASGALARTIVPTLENYGFDPRHHMVEQASVRNGVLWLTMNDPCGSGFLLRIDFATGAELSRRAMASVNVAYSLVVGSAPFAAVPTAGEVALVLLAFVLAAAGSLVLKLR